MVWDGLRLGFEFLLELGLHLQPLMGVGLGPVSISWNFEARSGSMRHRDPSD